MGGRKKRTDPYINNDPVLKGAFKALLELTATKAELLSLHSSFFSLDLQRSVSPVLERSLAGCVLYSAASDRVRESGS